MRITLRSYYAVIALAVMASRSGEGGRVRMEEISAEHPIPEPFLLQIFQVLRRGGLIRSKRGTGGGYALTRPPDRITLSEILQVVEGPILPSPLEERANGREIPSGWAGLEDLWGEIRSKVLEVGDSHTLADIAERLNRREDAEMYYI